MERSGRGGSFRFINRVWRIVSHFQGELAQKVTGYDTSKLDEADKELRRVLHNTIKKLPTISSSGLISILRSVR